MAVELKITANDDGTIAVKRLGDQTEKTADKIDRSAKRINNSMSKVGATIGRLSGKIQRFARLGATAMTGIGIAAITMAADLDKGVAEIGTLMDGVTEGQIKGMKKELRDLSVAAGQSLKPLIKARYDIVSAGFRNAADSAAVLDAVVTSSVAGVTDAASAAGVIIKALNSYSLSADSAAEVSDVLFTTVKMGVTTFGELASSMGVLFPVSKSIDMRLEDVGAAMALVTAGGLETGKAAIYMRQSLVQLIKAAEEGSIELVRYADGTLNMYETFKQFQGLDLQALKKIIPDQRSGTFFAVIANNFEKLAPIMKEFEKRSGSTKRAFDIISERAGFKAARAFQKLKDIMIEFGDQALPIVTELAEDITKSISDNMPKIVETFKTIINGFKDFIQIVKDNREFIKVAFAITAVAAFGIQIADLVLKVKALGLAANVIFAAGGIGFLITAGAAGIALIDKTKRKIQEVHDTSMSVHDRMMKGKEVSRAWQEAMAQGAEITRKEFMRLAPAYQDALKEGFSGNFAEWYEETTKLAVEHIGEVMGQDMGKFAARKFMAGFEGSLRETSDFGGYIKFGEDDLLTGSFISGLEEIDSAMQEKTSMWAGLVMDFGTIFENSMLTVANTVGQEWDHFWNKFFGKGATSTEKVANAMLRAFTKAIVTIGAQAMADMGFRLLLSLFAGPAAFSAPYGTTLGVLFGVTHSGGRLTQNRFPTMHNGGMNSDERLAKVQLGEYMIRKSSVNAGTLPMLEHINQTGSTGGINVGGSTIVVNGNSRTSRDKIDTFIRSRDQETADMINSMIEAGDVDKTSRRGL